MPPSMPSNRKASLQTLKHYKCLCNSWFISIQILRNFAISPKSANSLIISHVLSLSLCQNSSNQIILILSPVVTFSQFNKLKLD